MTENVDDDEDDDKDEEEKEFGAQNCRRGERVQVMVGILAHTHGC